VSGDQGGRDLAVAAPSAHTEAETAPLGRWPILARAPCEDGRTCRRTTPKSPVRLTGGRTRLLPADWLLGGRQCPEELPWPSRASLERVSSCDPKVD